MSHLEKLNATGKTWTLNDDGSFLCNLDEKQALKVVKAEREWVIVLLLDGSPLCGQCHKSFKALLASLRS